MVMELVSLISGTALFHGGEGAGRRKGTKLMYVRSG